MRVSAMLVWSLVAVMVVGCEPDKPKASPQPEAVPVVWTSSQELAQSTAEHWVARAKERAFSDAILRARSQVLREEEEAEPGLPRELATSAQRFTFVFSANNHGEREDCGCKRNPLGGLTRRATLLDMTNKTSSDVVAARYWESKVERDGTLFVVDAGDALFKSTTVKSSPKSAQDKAMRHAEGVIDALNLRPPDALNVGEHDLALGEGALQMLAKRASFSFISANLRKAGSSDLLFPGHVVVEREGKKVAYIGLTKQHARVTDYYKQQGVEVDAAKAAYIREVAALPEGMDVVVMLNNEGIPATQVLINELRAEGVRVDVALVSNSNMNTKKPRWTAGVPVLEPMSRGKHLGRLDLWVKGSEPPSFINDVPSKVAALDAYRRTWHGYLQASYQLEKLQERIARQRVILELGEVPTTGSKGESEALDETQIAAGKARAKKALARAESQLGPLEQRVALTSKDAMAAAALLDTPVVLPARGDDWAQVHIVPVLLEIPEEPATRRVLDRYKD